MPYLVEFGLVVFRVQFTKKRCCGNVQYCINIVSTVKLIVCI